MTSPIIDISGYNYMEPINNPVIYTPTVSIPDSAVNAMGTVIYNSAANLLNAYWGLFLALFLFSVSVFFFGIIPHFRAFMERKLFGWHSVFQHDIKVRIDNSEHKDVLDWFRNLFSHKR